jgi:hypothetical protein
MLNWLDDNVPWWPLIAGVLLLGLGAGIGKSLHRGGNGKPPKPLPPVTAKCSIEHGVGRLDLSPGTVGRWPPLKALVTMERGIGRAPSPLPIVEQTDG